MDPQLSFVNYSESEFTRLSDISVSNQPNVLKDNYSLEEIFKIKLKELIDLLGELNDLSESDSSLPPEKTFIDFATFFKDKSSFIASLSYVLRDTVPGFPKYRAEAILKTLENLEQEIVELKNAENEINRAGLECSSKSQSSINRCKNLQEVMEKSNDDLLKSKVLTTVSSKILHEKFDVAKQDLNIILETLYPENESMKQILAQLVKASEKTGEDRWIKITEDMDINCISTLSKQGIVKKHPVDNTKITLVSFSN